MSEEKPVIAVFGDVHGAWHAMYDYCLRWECATGRHIELVLQVGDLGVFPAGAELDKATRQHAANDPTELGAEPYLSGESAASHKTLFVRGNHESFEFLARFRNGGAIDPAGQVEHLVSHRPVTVGVGSTTVVIGGLGGIAPPDDPRGVPRPHACAKYFDDAEVKALLALQAGSVDILLTHDGPHGKAVRGRSDAGSEWITAAIEHLQPHYHFFGHYGDPSRPFRIGGTTCVGMNHRHAFRLPRRDGAMGILDAKAWSFEFVAV